MEGVIKEIESEDVTDNQNAESSKKRSYSKMSRDRFNIIKQLSDGTSYKTDIDSATKWISFKNEHFEELKDILKYMKGIINSHGLNHVFIKDIRSIIRVLDSRVWPNNWTICITRTELKDITFRINLIQEYIHNVCFPTVDSKVSKICAEAVLDDFEFFDNKRNDVISKMPILCFYHHLFVGITFTCNFRLLYLERRYHVYRKTITNMIKLQYPLCTTTVYLDMCQKRYRVYLQSSF